MGVSVRSSIPVLRFIGAAAALAVSISGLNGCGKGPAVVGAAAAVRAQPSLLISPEDLISVRSNTLSSGPAVTGSVQPERWADLRAEVAAVVLQVLKENGDLVHRGDLLVRLDDTAIRDTLTAADAAARAAEQALAQGERQFQRMTTLRKSGIVSAEQLEDAEIKRNTEQSDLEAARTRVVTARQQLERTEVRAPFDGVVSDRKVSAGDTAQIGKELVKVIDPHSLRFEGLVSADGIGEVKVGQRVMFRVHGFDEREFPGSVTRINPAANATTRQVEVLVSFADKTQAPEIAGLYAEGRIETRSMTALTIPFSALVREGDQTYAWRLEGRSVHKVRINVGDRDPRSGDFPLLSGIAQGDQLIRYPTATLREGQRVETGSPASAAAVSEAPASVATISEK
jgi:membrane fusion protein, multidrug efflux system